MNARAAAGPEITRGLLRALRPALAPGATATERAVARDVAQVLGLDGLDAVLAEVERTRGQAQPPDLVHVFGRLARLADEAAREESALGFLTADAELGALARALAETDWRAAGDSAVAVHAAADVLGGLPLEPNPDLARARLTGPVAASLRAALEWIGADEALLVQSWVHDSALSLTCPAAHAGGVGPAGAVLAAVEGSLGLEPDGRWTLRVPLYADRPSFLLLRLGHVPVALPWHSVARMRMLPPAEWAEQPEPVIEPLTTAPAGAEERPGALVALGLARGWLLADRVVWRFSATPEEVAERGPFSASTRVVSVENGERYWVLEPGWLLRAVPPTPVAPPAPRPRHAPAAGAPPAVTPTVPAAAPAQAAAPASPAAASGEQASLADAVARAIEALRHERAAAPAPRQKPAGPVRSASTPPPPPTRPALRQPGFTPPPSHGHLSVLRPSDVVPLGPAPAPPAPARGAVPPQPPAPAPAAERPSGAVVLPGRRALVADDSLVARIFLARLLERRGYVVEVTGDGAGMWELLGRGPWSLVCADVTMPDTKGRPHLERLLEFRAASREPFRLIALTRDAGEEREADEAGARLHLRKPFDPAVLDELLDQ